MIGVLEAFAPSYAKSRVKFLEAAATAGLQIESFNHPLPGKDGEVLALDTALQGAANGKVAEKLLVVSSASHDGNAFGGSGAQVFALHDAEWMDKVSLAGASVLYLHGIDQSLTDVVKKHVATAKQVIWLDISASNGFKISVNEALLAAKSATKCKFSTVKVVAVGEPAWEGQTISLARQAMFKAVDALNKA
jgi:Protein of unknown function (DUF2817)